MSNTPKLDVEIDRVNRERAAQGFGPLTREKAKAQIAAERLIADAKSRGMQVTPGLLDLWAWLILEPVIEDT